MEQKVNKKKYPLSASSYTLLEEVGQGASALVYRAKCITLNEIVAIKVLDMERCNSSLDDVRREAQTMSLISHPNVLSAFCSFVVDHNLWVVMPYMAGGSCLHIMKSSYPDGFEEPIIATVLKECLKALEYLHAHGHIHRDVKAGNILIDAHGNVKLGDFGVSACMFDTGDRQRARNTFVGTPCWMAPEVLEQVHGYDFKADIWSFGITALELAHGHAPFSKYPPMKVLLMTLQNAPPGLDYERDKRFSKSFKEMIAMCLVKNPARRPTAEKLLKHSFFKHTKSPEYLVRTVLDGLAPLGQRFQDLKVKDAERLAQKQMPFGEKEERSQTEYKRGVSSWNFDIEDLKAQAAAMQDDDGCFATGKEDAEQMEASTTMSDTVDDGHGPITLHSLSSENVPDAGGPFTRVRSGPLPLGLQSGSEELIESCAARDDEELINKGSLLTDTLSIQQLAGDPKISEADSPLRENKGEAKKVDKSLPYSGDVKREDKPFQNMEERDLRSEKVVQEGRRASSGPLVPEYVLAMHRGREEEKDSGRLSFRGGGDDDTPRARFQRERAYSGPLTMHGTSFDHRFMNGFSSTSKQIAGSKDVPDKGLYVQKKGRFSVTSADVELMEDHPATMPTRRSASMQVLQSSPASPNPTNPIPNTAVLACLQNLLSHTSSQQELLVSMINNISRGEPLQVHGVPDSSAMRQNYSGSGARSSDSLEVEISSDREHELLQQVSELQNRLVSLVDELQTQKLKNISLERQLNALYNKKEEERIRREDEADED